MTQMTAPRKCLELAQSIQFRFVAPENRFSPFWQRAARWCNRFGVVFDALNARIPPSHRRDLSPLMQIPRMSTAAIAAVIDCAVRDMREDEAFVNVGVWHGFSFLSGLMMNPEKLCIGIDNFSQFGGPKQEFLNRFNIYKSSRHVFHDVDYEEYFSKLHKGPIGVYLYDGDHSYHNQFNGLSVAEPYFGPDCLVLVDDTNDEEPRQATIDFIARSRNEYEIVFDARTHANMHPTWWNGLMIVQRKS